MDELSSVFVTLRRRDELRGCIGEIGATRPLAESVVDRAFGAAFRDPRFPALQRDEVHDTEIHVSVQGPLTPIEANDESGLLRQLRAAAGRMA